MRKDTSAGFKYNMNKQTQIYPKNQNTDSLKIQEVNDIKYAIRDIIQL